MLTIIWNFYLKIKRTKIQQMLLCWSTVEFEEHDMSFGINDASCSLNYNWLELELAMFYGLWRIAFSMMYSNDEWIPLCYDTNRVLNSCMFFEIFRWQNSNFMVKTVKKYCNFRPELLPSPLSPPLSPLPPAQCRFASDTKQMPQLIVSYQGKLHTNEGKFLMVISNFWSSLSDIRSSTNLKAQIIASSIRE